MSPFEVVYGFNPNSPLDLTPLPPAEAVSLEGESKAEFIKKLHQKVKENIEKKTAAYEQQHNKGRKAVVFKKGDWVWLHFRPERFPHKRTSKLSPRGDGPFRVLKRINDNAYQLELPGEFNVSSTFNVSDLERFDAGNDPVLRTKHFQEGGNDEDIGPNQSTATIPEVPSGPMTRQRARALSYKFSNLVDHIMSLESDELELEHGDHEACSRDHTFPSKVPWALLTTSIAASSVFTIHPE